MSDSLCVATNLHIFARSEWITNKWVTNEEYNEGVPFCLTSSFYVFLYRPRVHTCVHVLATSASWIKTKHSQTNIFIHIGVTGVVKLFNGAYECISLWNLNNFWFYHRFWFFRWTPKAKNIRSARMRRPVNAYDVPMPLLQRQHDTLEFNNNNSERTNKLREVRYCSTKMAVVRIAANCEHFATYRFRYARFARFSDCHCMWSVC